MPPAGELGLTVGRTRSAACGRAPRTGGRRQRCNNGRVVGNVRWRMGSGVRHVFAIRVSWVRRLPWLCSRQAGAFPKVTCPFTATTSRIQARSVSTVRPVVMGALPDLVLRNHRPSSEEEVSLPGHRFLHAAIEPSRQTVRAFLDWQSDITLNPRAAIATSTDRFLLAGWFRRRLVRVVAPEETSPSQGQLQLAQSRVRAARGISARRAWRHACRTVAPGGVAGRR
jgi:hypothetical protein